jgi:TolB-like protein/Tfp pilus assembly protein PilF
VDLSLLSELKRRRVFRALVGYGIAAFAVLQIIEPVMHGLHWPDEVLSYVVVALGVGFPVVVGLAWIFDVNAGRIERTAPAASPGLRGVRLGLLLVAIGAAAAAPGVAWYFALRPGARAPPRDDALRATLDAAPPASDIRALPSIAVLPFVDMSAAKDQEYFSDGIAEEILNALAQIEGLRVTGRTSSFSFKGKSEDLRSIGRKLGVNAVLEGSVRKAGNRVRVTAQVVNVEDGFHLWSQSYDRDLGDIFAVQDEIANAVVDALKVKLLSGATPSPKVRPAHDPEAYRLVLLGRSLAFLASEDGISRSLASLTKAVAIEPSYAPAWALMAQLHGNITRRAPRVEIERRTREALDEAERAIALDPQFEGGYAARGYARGWLLWDWNGARADLDRAMTLNSRSAEVLSFHAGLMQKLGRLKESIAVGQKVVQINPLDADAWSDLSAYLLHDGQLRAAREAYSRSQEISPGNAESAGLLALIDLLDGKAAEAMSAIQKLPKTPPPLKAVAIIQHDLGHPRESDEAVHELASLVEGPAGNIAYDVATVHAWRGERERAFEWLDRAYARHDLGLRLVKVDPLLRKLHGDPRFTRFLRKMNLPTD